MGWVFAESLNMAKSKATLPTPPPLRFIVAPHLVQDLGLNLYTNLPKVLVEYVANAYDADSPYVDIRMNFTDIEYQRSLVKAAVEKEKKAAEGNPDALAAIIPLGKRVLPATITVKIIDRGCGMSRDDLANQFLVAGRRRREFGATTTTGGRLLMGRKGVGKLAGFGMAQKIKITTRKKNEPHATHITLDYNEIGKHRTTNDIVIPEILDPMGGGIPISGGTEVVLSMLLHEPLRTQQETIERDLSNQFWLITSAGFQIKLNGTPLRVATESYRYAWPKPDVPPEQLVDEAIETEDQQSFPFRYRLRFREESLKAAERGVRLYAHGRLAAAPSLLDAPTGMHGFRQTDYLDGVVEANFIDDQANDYIATDRQSVRWDTPLLAPLRKFLSDEIKKAVLAFQKVRDEKAEKEAEEDPFTNNLIKQALLPKHSAKAVHKMAAALASICKDGTAGSEYKDRIKILVSGVEQGDILAELQKLSREALPNFTKVVDEVTELTKQEFGDFGRYLRGRLSGILSLTKIIEHQNFALGKNEKELHQLLERNPWLIDPTYTQFLTSNQTEDTVFAKLAKELKLGNFAPTRSDTSAERPDLVFLLHSKGLNRLIIIELKAPNVKLGMEHLLQLRDYVREAREWLKKGGRPEVIIESILIGVREKMDTKAKDVKRLESELSIRLPTDAERVYDLNELLDMTKKAHEELLAIHKQQSKN